MTLRNKEELDHSLRFDAEGDGEMTTLGSPLRTEHVMIGRSWEKATKLRTLMNMVGKGDLRGCSA
jgi:hypothetical protein